jgi:hypothetical protein
MSGTKFKTGSWTGDGAAKNISLGFKPHLVIVQNITDGTVIDMYIDADTGTDPTGSIDIDATAGPVTDAGGITPYAGDTANARGFSLDAGNNVNAKVYRYAAFGKM